MSITSTPHIVVIPYPAQGHVIPLLEFSQCLAEHGFRVTFVNSEYYHRRVLISIEGKNYIGDKIHLVSIPDGLEPWEDRNDFGNLTQKLLQVMPGKLQELIDQINGREGQSIDCVIADGIMGWAIEVAEKMNIKRAAVWPASAASLALSVNIPKLIDDGIIDSNGTIIKKQMIQLATDMPELSTANFLWATMGDLRTQKIMFDLVFHGVKAMKAAEYLFCNSTYDLESAAFSLVPELLPIGPLLASNRLGDSAGYFWPEDSHCLKWLDQQKSNSVIYVAFGSIALFDKIQFEELALGLELCNRPFLWVVRQGITKDENDAYPEGFHDRIATRGRMVNWAPQQKVLSHPSIACFLSHCGWNSTVEGVSNGVTFLCWPYFADQFMNESYICDAWNVGLKFNRNESGIITREEIKSKVAQVLGEGNFKARALELKEKTMSSVPEGGFSKKAIQNFIEWIKA